jgi:hypothetical protein
MKIINVEQRSPEWYAARLGVPSASNFDKIVMVKGERSKQAEKYMYKLAGEILSGTAEESYQNAAMQRGTELEAEARNLYQMINDVEVEEVGFCITDGYGCSPDGFVGDDGLIEIKCPQMATHVGYLLDAKAPTDYFQQTQGQLLVTGRKWCDFVSHYPAIKPLIVRVERDEKFLKALKSELESFCQELKDIVEKLKEK